MKNHLVFLLSLLFLVHCAHGPKKDTAQPRSAVTSKGNSLYYYIISELQALEGEEDQSLFYLDKALKKEPGSTFLMTDKAYQYARQNKLDEAEKLAKEAHARNPSDFEVNLLLAKIYSSRKESDQAVSYYQKAIAIDPQSEEAYTLLAREYMADNQPQMAISTLNRLIAVNPEAISAYFYLGSIYATVEKDYRRAIAAYEKLLEQEPNDPKILQILSEIYLAQKDHKNALRTLETLREMSPDDTAIQVRIALLYYEIKDIERAIAEFESILAVNPRADRILYYLGLLYQEKKEYEKSIDKFSQIKPDSSFYADAVIRQIVILKNQDRMDRALNLARKAMNLKPQSPEFYDLLASLYVLQKNYSEAVSVLKEGLARIPNDENLFFSMAVLLERTGQWEESIRYMREVLKINAENSSALNFIGYTYAEHGINLDEAEGLVEQALKLKPDDGFIVDSLGWVYYQRGNLSKALNLLQKANRLAPDEPTILEHLAEVYLKMKNKRLARQFFERSLFALNKKEDRDPRDEEQIQRIQVRISEL